MTQPSRILVIGSTGLVGSEFIRLASKKTKTDKIEVVGVDEKQLDITNKVSIEKYFRNNNFDVVINFAAFTDVDKAELEREDEKGLVWRLNVEGVENLAKALDLK